MKDVCPPFSYGTLSNILICNRVTWGDTGGKRTVRIFSSVSDLAGGKTIPTGFKTNGSDQGLSVLAANDPRYITFVWAQVRTTYME